jgi:hypothetical protein
MSVAGRKLCEAKIAENHNAIRAQRIVCGVGFES